MGIGISHERRGSEVGSFLPFAASSSYKRPTDGHAIGDESSALVKILGLFIGLLYLGVWITISVRLLRTAARTRMAPEIAMGAYFTLLTTSHLLGIPSLLLQNAEHPLASTVSAAALFCFFPAALALAIGTWRMFRPTSRWSIALCIVLSVQMGAAWWFTVRSGEVVSLFTAGTPNLIFTMGRTAIYAWAFGEAFQYYRTAQKRVALGLADPVSQSESCFGVSRRWRSEPHRF